MYVYIRRGAQIHVEREREGEIERERETYTGCRLSVIDSDTLAS